MAIANKITKIGKYEVIDIIGRGGMGVVYQAKDPYLDRLVAIKMMNVDIHESSDFLERFYREAKSTASLQHPNIVTVYDLGEYESRPFLVMQYLEGHSLESLLRAHHPLTLLEKINIIIEVCQGLGYAHQHGIIHRDIKPGNIMVLNDGSVKIVDFGIARLGDKTLTRTGQIVGSLYYMPPEQFLDKPLDKRADVYSAGVVLYQLLTYSLPFEGENTGSTLAKIISEPPPPFSQFAVSYPPELEVITLKALAKDRDQRFATAEALAVALAEVQDHFKQESIKEYLSKAELLQQSNELLQAQDYLLKVLKLDRQHTTAAKQLGVVRANLQAQLCAERVRQLKQQAEEAYERDEFDAALAFMKQAIELDNSAELQTLWANIEKTKAEAEFVRKAIARAEAAQRSGDLDSAKSAIDTAFSHHPDDSKIKVLRRAIERDLEEREHQRQVEGLLDQARKQMAGRKFTAALDLLREAQQLDPSAPQLRILLERLATEHQQEKQRRELERFNHEVQEAIDRDDYKAASAKAAEALGKFPHEAGLARLKELADAQIEIAAQKEFVRNQTAAVQELLDSGQTQHAMDAVEKALQKVPGNARLESLRELIHNRMIIERTQADKATCLRQANDAISLGRYPDAIQILKGAQARFVDATEFDALVRFCRDQQVKARHQALVEEAIRTAQQLLAKQDFDGAVKLLQKAVDQVPSEDLDILLRQAREQRDGFQRDLEGAIAKGKKLLEEGAIANAREFLSSRPVSYQQSTEFRDLIEEAHSTPIPVLPIDSARAEATQMFSGVGASPATATEREVATTIFPRVEPEPVPEEPSELAQTKLAPPWKRNPLVIGAVALAVVVAGLIIWWMMPAKPKEAYLNIHTKPGADVRVVGENMSGKASADGNLALTVPPGHYQVQVSSEGYENKTESVTVSTGERHPLEVELIALPPPPKKELPPTPTGNLLVRSNVPGADVFIDGRQWKDPTGRDNKLKVPLDTGMHRVQLKASGYQDSGEQPVEIVAKKEKQLSFKLIEIESQTYLKIESEPPGASVRIDDKAAGSTANGRPLSKKVLQGSHTVQFNLDSYEPYTARVVVKEGENLPIRVRLKLTPPAEIKQFWASPDTIQKGQSAKLNWTTQDATEVSIEPEIGTVSPSGARDVSPGKTTTYTITAKWSGGSKTSTTNITVEKPPPPVEPPRIVSFAPTDATIQEGQETRLKWETQNATSVSISPGIGKVEASGERPLKPTRTIDFTLTATGPGGSADPRSVTITVTAKAEPPPPPPLPLKPKEVGADVDAIKDLVHVRFKEAYEGTVFKELQSVWPSLTESDFKRMNLNKLKSIRLTDTCAGSPSIKGDEADWNCEESVSFVAGDTRQHLKPSLIAFHFKKNNGNWYVDRRPAAR